MRGSLALALCAALAACSGQKSVEPTAVVPPVTRAAPVTDSLHGVQIVDDFRWLEDASPDVAAWTNAQNSHTRNVLDNLPGRSVLEGRLKTLLRVGSVTAPVMRGNRYFFTRRAATQDHPVIYARDGSLGADRELIDPIKLDVTRRTAVAWFSPSEDGRMLAYGTYREGEPVSTLRLLDVDSLALQPLEIPNVLQEVQWLPDRSGFVYHSVRDPRDPNSRQGQFHRIGTSPASDVVLYRQVSQPQNPNPAQTGGPSGTLSRDGRWIVLNYWLNPVSNDIWIARFDEFLRKGSGAAKVVSVGVPGQALGTVIGDVLYLHTTKGAPRGRIVAVNTSHPEQWRWREIVPERSDAVIQTVAFGRGTIAVTYSRNASTAIEVFDLDGRPLGTLAQPGAGSASITTSEDRTEAYLAFTSFTYPQTVLRVDLSTPTTPPRYWSGPDTPIDPSIADVRQVSYPSKDGTTITMFLVHKKGLAQTGDTPIVLTGHGAFNVSMHPMFWGPFFQWIEAGGILAVPHLRGGGEYGEAWHQAGMLERKRNTIDDLIAAAEWLVAKRYTNPQKLAVHGITNGGLAAAAAVTERPELFRAAVLARPLIDMLRYHKFASAPYWVEEYGSADDLKQFKWLFEYSPYQRVKGGTKYPALLITGAEEDPEVPTLHARKAAAAFQAATTSDKSQQPVLLRIDRPTADAAALLALELRDVVDQQLFLRWQLGLR